MIWGIVLALLACALPVACMWVFRHFLQEGPVRVEMIRLHTAHCPFSMVARKPSGRGGRPPSVCLVRWAVKLSMHFHPLELDFEWCVQDWTGHINLAGRGLAGPEDEAAPVGDM